MGSFGARMSRVMTEEPLIIQAESEWRPERNPAGKGTKSMIREIPVHVIAGQLSPSRRQAL